MRRDGKNIKKIMKLQNRKKKNNSIGAAIVTHIFFFFIYCFFFKFNHFTLNWFKIKLMFYFDLTRYKLCQFKKYDLIL